MVGASVPTVGEGVGSSVGAYRHQTIRDEKRTKATVDADEGVGRVR